MQSNLQMKMDSDDLSSLVADRYQDYLYAPDSQDFSWVWSDLDRNGAAVIPGFIKPEKLSELVAQSKSAEDLAFFKKTRTNIYNTEEDLQLPEEHPARHYMDRTQGFVASDLIPENFLIRRLYHSLLFKNFVAKCLQMPVIYEYSDPFAALVLNVCRPGCSHPWHYDTNEFIVSMMTNPCDEGGLFEYCPQIRKPGDENLEAVSRVLRGCGSDLVKQINLQPGDLQIFKGRFSLHRVTEVEGSKARITAIFAYAEKQDMCGKAERSKQLFGRVAKEHYREQKRLDALLD